MLRVLGILALAAGGLWAYKRKGGGSETANPCQFTSGNIKKAVDEAEFWVRERLGTSIDVGGAKLAAEYWKWRAPKCKLPGPLDWGKLEPWSVNGATWQTVRLRTAQAIDEIEPAAPDFRRVARALLGLGLDTEV